MTDEFVSLVEVSRLLGVSDSALRMRLRRRALPFDVFHEGRRLIARRADVMEYVSNLRPVGQPAI